jgi:hypothetical protein
MSDVDCKISVKNSLGNSKANMESSEPILARDEFLSSEQCSVEDSVGSLYQKCYDTDINNRCSHQGVHLIVDHTEDCYTTPEDASNGKYEYIGNRTNNSHSAIEGLEVNNQGIILATNSENNLHSNIDDLGKKLEHYNKLTNNVCILSIAKSTVQSDHILKTLKEDNKVCTTLSSPVNNSGHFELVCSAVSPEQEDHIVLPANYEELCSGDLLWRASGSKPEVCLPLSVDCAQYDEGNKRQYKRKQRNKKRKRRSRAAEMQTE